MGENANEQVSRFSGVYGEIREMILMLQRAGDEGDYDNNDAVHAVRSTLPTFT